jgi:hypothetical protein
MTPRKKKQSTIDQLNVSLAGVDSALTIIKTLAAEENPNPALKQAIETAQRYAEEAHGHLLTVQFHLAQL